MISAAQSLQEHNQCDTCYSVDICTAMQEQPCIWSVFTKLYRAAMISNIKTLT
jgi:hypothetical protein